MLIKAPAKLNLTLNIYGKKNDYHLLNTLVIFGIVFDNIKIEMNVEKRDQVDFSGKFIKYISPENNIITRILKAARNKNKQLPFFKIEIEKNIPVAAGLGGGSSDAGAMLRFLREKYNIQFAIEEIVSFGADVNMCFNNFPAIYDHFGEILVKKVNLPRLYILLVNPMQLLLTKNVFERYKKLEKKFTILRAKHLLEINKIEKLLLNIQKYGNDLLDPAIILMPEISKVLKLMGEHAGCLYSNLSGSGATCFALFDNYQNLEKAGLHFKREYAYYWVDYNEI